MDLSLPTPLIAPGHPYRLPRVVWRRLDLACLQGCLWAVCLHRAVAGLAGTAGWTADRGLWQCLAGSLGCVPSGGAGGRSALEAAEHASMAHLSGNMAYWSHCSVSLPFISSHFWMKTGQSLLQLTCPSIPQDMHCGRDPGVQIAVLCRPAQVPHVSCISLQS